MRNPCTMKAIHRLCKTIGRFRHAYRALGIDWVVIESIGLLAAVAGIVLVWRDFDAMGGFEGAGFPESHGLPLIILLLGYLVFDQSRMVLLALAMLFRNLRSRREAGEQAEQHQQEIRGNQ